MHTIYYNLETLQKRKLEILKVLADWSYPNKWLGGEKVQDETLLLRNLPVNAGRGLFKNEINSYMSVNLWLKELNSGRVTRYWLPLVTWRRRIFAAAHFAPLSHRITKRLKLQQNVAERCSELVCLQESWGKPFSCFRHARRQALRETQSGTVFNLGARISQPSSFLRHDVPAQETTSSCGLGRQCGA